MIPGDSGKVFEVIGVLVDLGPFQAEGFQLCPSSLLSLRVLVLSRKFREELLPNSRDVVDWLERVDPFPHGSCPFSDEWSLDKREGEGDSLDIRSHAGYLAIESNVCFQLVDK